MSAGDDTGYLDTYLQPAANQEAASELIGPPFVGWLLHCLLFGCVATNTFNYYYSSLYKTERRRNKTIMWILFSMDFCAMGVSFAQAVHYGTQQHRDTNTLLLGVTPLDAVPFGLSGTIALITQVALADRAAKFIVARTALRRMFLAVVGIFGGFAWVASMAVTVFYGLFAGGFTSSLINSNYSYNVVTFVWAMLSALTDIFISATLFWALRVHVKGFNHKTDRTLKKIIRIGMETCATTSLAALVGAILAICWTPAQVTSVNILFVPIYPLSSLYVLTFLSTLRARECPSTQTPSVVYSTIAVDGLSPRPPHVWLHRERTWVHPREKGAEHGSWSAPKDRVMLALPPHVRPGLLRNYSYPEAQNYNPSVLAYTDTLEVKNASIGSENV